MWITWLIIVLAVAMVVGPIMMVQPTPGMSRIAKIRTAASQIGLTVRLDTSKSNSTASAAVRQTPVVYSLPHSKALRDRGPIAQWVLERKTYAHELHFHGQWDWRGAGRADTRQYPVLVALVEALSDDLSSIECNAGGLGCQWNEACHGKSAADAVGEVRDLLALMADKLERALGDGSADNN